MSDIEKWKNEVEGSGGILHKMLAKANETYDHINEYGDFWNNDDS